MLKVLHKIGTKQICQLFIIISILIVISGIFSWLNNEPARFMGNAFDNGFSVQFADFKKAFDVLAFDGLPRVRFLSNLFKVFDNKLLIWFSEHFYHNYAISFNWILSLLISPIILWKLIKGLTDEQTAWMATAFYMTSVGFLSTNVMYLHVGKSLTITFTIIAMYVIYQLKLREERSIRGDRRDLLLFSILSLIYFLSLNSDETGLLSLGLSLFLFPKFILKTRRGRLIIFTVMLTGLIFLGWIVVLAPSVVKNLGYGDFNFITGLSSLKHQMPFWIWILTLLFNLLVFFNINIDPFYGLSLYHFGFLRSEQWTWKLLHKFPEILLINPKNVNAILALLWYLILPVVFLLLFIFLSRERDKKILFLLKWSLVCFLIIVVFETLASPHPRSMNYYYGALLCLPTSIGFASLLSRNIREKVAVTNLKKILLVFLAVVSLGAFYMQNQQLTAWEEARDFSQEVVKNFIIKKRVVRKKAGSIYSYAQKIGVDRSDVCLVYSEWELYYRMIYLSTITDQQIRPNCKLRAYISEEGVKKILLVDEDITRKVKL